MSLVRCVFHDVSGWISDGKARSLEVKYVSRVTDFFCVCLRSLFFCIRGSGDLYSELK